jgi:hypothetical protein
MFSSLTVETLDDLRAEVARAKAKFPLPNGLIPALFEEFAEYCSEEDPAKRRKELLQVACVALRLYEETDPLEDDFQVVDLKRMGAALELYARTALCILCGEAAAAKSHE